MCVVTHVLWLCALCPACRAHSVLHRYRASEGIQVPFKVIPMVKELGRTRMEANVSVRSLFGAKLFALNTVVRGADVLAVVCTRVWLTNQQRDAPGGVALANFQAFAECQGPPSAATDA